MPRISALFSYPIKGCAGVPLSTAALTPAGLPYDRSWMVTDPAGTFRSQRADPRLALARPSLTEDGGRLTLRAEGLEPVAFEVDATGPSRPVSLFGQPFTGIDQGPEAADWFTELLGRPSRLVRVPPDHRRVTDGRTPGTCGYADSGAVLVASLASLAELNRRIVAGGGRPLPMDRFRPNVVLDGLDLPHGEDGHAALETDTARLEHAKLAIRCAVTLVDQRAGVRGGPEPLRTLAHYRRMAGGGVAFGVKFSVTRCGTLAVGDRPRITALDAAEV
ncbi:MOSC domain-containing protein [Streptomyces profundus]|uniref:MOSC domain-containing protein n=1 Tax=Streptomyces profundus TaxID=2867410 RepID=UPI001D15F082|nr:MOSC N-terminal beta barrel domain-containing protein [Streptomyces sp. MA3_2.13]UED83838.1 MOSC N-terminal beta barrel domain-containing protein [Streptomyces sp. MA3_2.13]